MEVPTSTRTGPGAPPVSAGTLRGQVGWWGAVSLVVGNMVGAGIFTTSGLLLAELGDVGLMLALWVVGGGVALCGALCYGVLGVAMPHAGGEYVYLTRLYHPLLGFLTGWVSIFAGFSAPLAASSLGFAEYLAQAFPALDPPGQGEGIKKLLAGILILALGWVHRRGVETGTRLQNWLTLGKVVLIVALVGFGFALGRGHGEPWAGGVASSHGGGGLRRAGLALLWIMFAYSGWNAAAYIGSELRNPRRTLPRSLLAGTALVTVLYVALNLLFAYALPPREMAGLVAVGGAAAERLFGAWARPWLAGLIAFALLSSSSALVVLGPRVYWAMARDGAFFPWVGAVHPRFGTPSRAILLQCGLAILMVASGTFDQILTYMGFSLGIFPILAVLGVFRLDRLSPGQAPVWSRRLPAVLFAGAMASMLILSFQERPVESSVALATVTLGVPFYFVFHAWTRRSL